MLAECLLPTLHETFGLLVLFVLLLNHTLDHVVLFLSMSRQGVGLGLFYLFLGGHVEYFEQVVDVEVVEVEGLQNDLTDHEVDVFLLQIYFFEEGVELLLGYRVFGIPLVGERLQNMLLVLCD